MRNAFIDDAVRAGTADDPRIVFVTGDLGFSVVERFTERFPTQFVNVGVAEQNMTGVAAGLALSGKIVFTYSIANFPTLRCLEQIRNDVCYHERQRQDRGGRRRLRLRRHGRLRITPSRTSA